jgi:hypothetical protein
VYDHPDPAARPGPFEVEPLLATLASGRAAVGPSDRLEQDIWLDLELAVPRTDVEPAVPGQNHAPALRIDRLPHEPIVLLHQSAAKRPL